MDEDVAALKAHCNHCGDETRHRVLHQAVTSGEYGREEPESDEPHSREEDDWMFEYATLECLGCGEVCVRETRRYWDPIHECTETEATCFPPRIFRRIPNWHHELPPDVAALMKEVYVALALDSRRLAVMGARTLVDLVITNTVGDQASFLRGLQALESAKVISAKTRDYLLAAIDVGNAVTHRAYAPPPEDLAQVLEIVEDLLRQVYILPAAGRELRRRTPPRPPTRTGRNKVEVPATLDAATETPSDPRPAMPAEHGGEGRTIPDAPEARLYVAFAGRGSFHQPGCAWTNALPTAEVIEFRCRDEAVAAGYRPCQACRP